MEYNQILDLSDLHVYGIMAIGYPDMVEEVDQRFFSMNKVTSRIVGLKSLHVRHHYNLNKIFFGHMAFMPIYFFTSLSLPEFPSLFINFLAKSSVKEVGGKNGWLVTGCNTPDEVHDRVQLCQRDVVQVTSGLFCLVCDPVLTERTSRHFCHGCLPIWNERPFRTMDEDQISPARPRFHHELLHPSGVLCGIVPGGPNCGCKANSKAMANSSWILVLPIWNA